MNPLHQFVVSPLIPLYLGKIDISLTNSSFFMLLSIFTGGFFLWASTRRRAIIPSVFQSISEKLYFFIKSIAETSVGRGYEPYLPFLLSVFIFVFMGNSLGLIPFGFTFTSQLAPIGAFAILGSLIATGLGLYHSGFSWFRHFLPKGIPLLLAPIMIPIEIISFLSKPFSLTVRLVMNMIVGHVLLKVIAGFIVSSGLFGFLPLFFTGVLILFELGIAFLQAYVYTILTGIYLGESLHKS